MNPSVELKLCNALNRLLDYGIIFIISAPIILDAYYCKIQEKDLYSYSEPYPVLYKDFDPEGWEFASNHLEPIPADADNGFAMNMISTKHQT